jgi:hypothetical protein
MVTDEPGSVDDACLDPKDRGPERLLAPKGCEPERLWARRASDARTGYGPEGYGLGTGVTSRLPLRHGGHLAASPLSNGPEGYGPTGYSPRPRKSQLCLHHQRTFQRGQLTMYSKMPQEVQEPSMRHGTAMPIRRLCIRAWPQSRSPITSLTGASGGRSQGGAYI